MNILSRYPAAPSDADVILEEVNCDSTTFFLLDCNNVLADGSGDCDHEDTVGVECVTANNASASTEVPLTNEPGLGEYVCVYVCVCVCGGG